MMVIPMMILKIEFYIKVSSIFGATKTKLNDQLILKTNQNEVKYTNNRIYKIYDEQY